jgi:glycosyltransferase involved in cell wall biosynthesis
LLLPDVLGFVGVRILLDYRSALVRRTGVGEYAHRMATALVSLLPAGDRLTLFSSSWKDRLEPGRIAGARVVDARVPVRVLNRAWHRLEWPPVEMLAGRIDIAHSMHPLLMPARSAARLVTVYDLFFLQDADGTAREIRRDYTELTANHARRADAVVVISDYTAREVATRLGVPPERIVRCPPGAPEWPRRRGPAPGGPIVCISSPERRKNLPGLLRAYAVLRTLVPDAPRLIIAGRTPDRGAEVSAMIRRPPWYPHVRHLGYVTEDERQDLYRQATMLVLPSLDEGFGMPLVEAMTVGVPVVASNRGALPEVAGDAALLVEPTDAEAMADAMRRLLEEPELARASVERGYRRAAHYSWQASAATLLQRYRELHVGRGGPAA